jgi:hypothetical protein
MVRQQAGLLDRDVAGSVRISSDSPAERGMEIARFGIRGVVFWVRVGGDAERTGILMQRGDRLDWMRPAAAGLARSRGNGHRTQSWSSRMPQAGLYW